MADYNARFAKPPLMKRDILAPGSGIIAAQSLLAGADEHSVVSKSGGRPAGRHLRPTATAYHTA
jgi:hypothetical protein